MVGLEHCADALSGFEPHPLDPTCRSLSLAHALTLSLADSLAHSLTHSRIRSLTRRVPGEQADGVPEALLRLGRTPPRTPRCRSRPRSVVLLCVQSATRCHFLCAIRETLSFYVCNPRIGVLLCIQSANRCSFVFLPRTRSPSSMFQRALFTEEIRGPLHVRAYFSL